MWFLIVQILLLLLLAALFGAWLMYWWMTNRQEDVTESYAELKAGASGWNVPDNLLTRDDLDAHLSAFGTRMDNLPLPDLDPVQTRLSSIEDKVSAFYVPETDLSPLSERLQYLEAQLNQPDPGIDAVNTRIAGLEETLNYIANTLDTTSAEPTDLSPVESRLESIEHAVNGIVIPDVDLGPLHSSLALIELGIDGLEMPSPNLEPVHDQIRTLDSKLALLSDRIDNARKADLEVLTSRFASLSSTLDNLDIPEQDLSPIAERLLDIETKLSNLDLTFEAPETDLNPVCEQIERLEQKIASPRADVETLNARLGTLEITLSEISGALSGMKLPNLQPIESRLERMEAINERHDGERRADLDTLAARITSLATRIETQESPVVDLRPIHTMLLGLERAITSIDRNPVDLSPILSRLSGLEGAFDDIRGGFQSLHSAVREDRSSESLERQIYEMDASLRELRQQKNQIDVDFGPVLDAIYRMDGRIDNRSVDLSPVLDAIHRMDKRPMDLGPVIDAVYKIDDRLIDLSAVENRLTSMEYGLAAMHDMLRARAEQSASRNDAIRDRPPVSREIRRDYDQRSFTTRSSENSTNRESRFASDDATRRSADDPIRSALKEGDRANLLKDAAFGPADDLELISGIGPMLSALLNDIGVYYFWQIAEWGDAEIEWVNDKLNAFKGRIERDDWVGQAKTLKDSRTAAVRPT